MKLLISNQHGAIVMALLPFCYGTLVGKPVWTHIFLLLTWCSLYLMTYPFLNLFKPQVKDKREYVRWTGIYAVTSAVFSIPVLWFNWQISLFGIAMLPFIAVSIYFTRTKNERAMLNDLAGILIFALAGMGAYYFSTNRFDSLIWQVGFYPTLFFIGVTLYVKSMLRERKNPRYYWASLVFHCACVGIFVLWQKYALSLVFVPPLLRAVFLPHFKLSVKQVGLIEFAVSAVFLSMLVWATL